MLLKHNRDMLVRVIGCPFLFPQVNFEIVLVGNLFRDWRVVLHTAPIRLDAPGGGGRTAGSLVCQLGPFTSDNISDRQLVAHWRRQTPQPRAITANLSENFLEPNVQPGVRVEGTLPSIKSCHRLRCVFETHGAPNLIKHSKQSSDSPVIYFITLYESSVVYCKSNAPFWKSCQRSTKGQSRTGNQI